MLLALFCNGFASKYFTIWGCLLMVVSSSSMRASTNEMHRIRVCNPAPSSHRIRAQLL